MQKHWHMSRLYTIYPLNDHCEGKVDSFGCQESTEVYLYVLETVGRLQFEKGKSTAEPETNRGPTCFAHIHSDD